MFKTWYIFYPHEILNTIYNELGLSKYEAELLTPEDKMKIQKYIDGKRNPEKSGSAMPPRQPMTARPTVQPVMP